MNAAELIEILRQVPPDKVVSFVCLGNVRGDIDYIYDYAEEIRLTNNYMSVRGKLLASPKFADLTPCDA